MHNLKAYQIHANSPETYIRIAPRERAWMDDTQDEYAYRCLPLTMANSHGWEICLNKKTSFVWNGGNTLADIKIISGSAVSVFGNGIITFHVGYMFRTEDPYNLYITGSPNRFFPGIYPLSGIYESNWAPYTFTMNWKITEPNRIIEFNKDDPICFVFPVIPNVIESFKLSVEDAASNPEIAEEIRAFTESRRKFLESDRSKLSSTENWQKHYFQGKYVDGRKCPFAHRTKVKMQDIQEEEQE